MDTMDRVETGKVKRLFRARMKFNAPQMISHLTQRASGADRLFHEPDDYLEMLRRLKAISLSHDLEVLSFVLMPNHLHLLVRQNLKNLPEAMRELFAPFARRQNVKYERKGHLFGAPYRQAVCLEEGYMLAVSLYIHLNPVRAGLAMDPLEYRWSSCRPFVRSGAPQSFVRCEMVLGLISPIKEEAVIQYGRMLEEGMRLRTREVLEDTEAIRRFQRRMVVANPEMNRPLLSYRHQEFERTLSAGIDGAQMEEMLGEFVEGRVRRMPQGREARRYLVEQLVSRGYTREEIARRLGISRKTIYLLLRRTPRD